MAAMAAALNLVRDRRVSLGQLITHQVAPRLMRAAKPGADGLSSRP